MEVTIKLQQNKGKSFSLLLWEHFGRQTISIELKKKQVEFYLKAITN